MSKLKTKPNLRWRRCRNGGQNINNVTYRQYLNGGILDAYNIRTQQINVYGDIEGDTNK